MSRGFYRYRKRCLKLRFLLGTGPGQEIFETTVRLLGDSDGAAASLWMKTLPRWGCHCRIRVSADIIDEQTLTF